MDWNELFSRIENSTEIERCGHVGCFAKELQEVANDFSNILIEFENMKMSEVVRNSILNYVQLTESLMCNLQAVGVTPDIIWAGISRISQQINVENN